MKRIKSLFFVVFLFSFVVSSAEAVVLAPLNIKLLGVGDSQVRYGAYVGLYQLGINNSSTIFAMCDDSLTDVYIGKTWTANRFTYADIQAGAPVKFASNGVEKYSQAGYLFSLLKNVSVSDRADINLAVWDIMSPGSIALTPTAESYYNTATGGAYNDFNFTGIVDILTPSPLNTSQEELVSAVPIPAAIWLFGPGFLGIIGITRRRRS